MPPSATIIMNGKPSQTLAVMQASKACAASPSQLTGAREMQHVEQPGERRKLLHFRAGSG